ncbi:MAG: enoyl-CoA hydratase-related protein, partial [Rhizobacter sp.]
GELGALDAASALVRTRVIREVFDAIRRNPVPVVAAVNGYALGGGMVMVSCCDIVVAADSASFGLPEINVGVMGGTRHLARIVPEKVMRWMALTGNRRYLDSYFDMYPGVWRHDDWIRITPRGGAIIYGRSDATINRHGIRMGTAELYRAVEAQPEVLDSLVVDLEYLGRDSYMPLFVVLREGLTLDAALDKRLRDAIKAALSARHVPNEIFQVDAIPRTLSGKKMELPVKKLLLGAEPAKVLNRDAMANAASIDWFVDFARRRAANA